MLYDQRKKQRALRPKIEASERDVDEHETDKRYPCTWNEGRQEIEIQHSARLCNSRRLQMFNAENVLEIELGTLCFKGTVIVYQLLNSIPDITLER